MTHELAEEVRDLRVRVACMREVLSRLEGDNANLRGMVRSLQGSLRHLKGVNGHKMRVHAAIRDEADEALSVRRIDFDQDGVENSGSTP